MGRTGKWFAIGHESIEPDVVAAAKGSALRMPHSAMIAFQALMNWSAGSRASTLMKLSAYSRQHCWPWNPVSYCGWVLCR